MRSPHLKPQPCTPALVITGRWLCWLMVIKEIKSCCFLSLWNHKNSKRCWLQTRGSMAWHKAGGAKPVGCSLHTQEHSLRAELGNNWFISSCWQHLIFCSLISLTYEFFVLLSYNLWTEFIWQQEKSWFFSSVLQTQWFPSGKAVSAVVTCPVISLLPQHPATQDLMSLYEVLVQITEFFGL